MQIQVKSAKEALINEVFFDKNTKKVSYKDKNGVITIVNQDAPSIEASTVPYDNTSSGLSSTEVQSAIDELAASGGGSAPTTTVVNISSAQILNMGSSPIELLPAPGVGKYYDYDIFLESSISALNLSGTNVVIGDQSDFGGTVVSGYALESSNGKFFRVNQSNPIYTITDGLATAAPIQMARVNFPIVMTTYGGTNPASCTGTMRAIITYTVRTFGA